MAVQKISITQFLELARRLPVLDVRSPGEYTHAHIPSAYNLPLFTDEERKVVGTAYKRSGKQTAIKIGLEYFGTRMKAMVEEVEALVAKRKDHFTQEIETVPGEVLVHCWRGGMRSEGIAWLLDLYGFKVRTLAGGYKAYRNWVHQQFSKTYPFAVIGGFTGSGKTAVLHELKVRGEAVIDLEAMAHHKGSAFGALGEQPQPSQELFENLLATALAEATTQISAPPAPNGQAGGRIYAEDEAMRIGGLHVPRDLWHNLQTSPLVFIEVPFEERLNYLLREYGIFEPAAITEAILRIQKRLGGQETKTAIAHLLENNYEDCFRILLKYYDKCYSKSLLRNEMKPSALNKIVVENVDVKTISNLLVDERFGIL